MPRRKFNKSTGRKYTGNSYDAKYGRRTSAQRSQRNKARRVKLKQLTKRHGAAKAKQMMKGKDVAHKNGLSNKPSNLKLSSPAKNRGRRGEGGRKRKKR